MISLFEILEIDDLLLQNVQTLDKLELPPVSWSSDNNKPSLRDIIISTLSALPCEVLAVVEVVGDESSICSVASLHDVGIVAHFGEY